MKVLKKKKPEHSILDGRNKKHKVKKSLGSRGREKAYVTRSE